mgnify:CR=1 FL=1
MEQILSILVRNQPGVLMRVSGMFSRRGFNIDSLAVGITQNPEFSDHPGRSSGNWHQLAAPPIDPFSVLFP